MAAKQAEDRKFQIWVCRNCGAVRRVEKGLREDDRPAQPCKCKDYRWIAVNTAADARRVQKELHFWEIDGGGYWKRHISKI